MFGNSHANSLGNSESAIGDMSPSARFFNPYPIQRHATD